EQPGRALHQPGALLERAPGALQRFGLPVQRCAGLLEQVEDGVDRREQASRQVRLEPALAVDYLLHELELALHGSEQIAWEAGAPAHRRRRGDDGVHQPPPLVEQVTAVAFRHGASTLSPHDYSRAASSPPYSALPRRRRVTPSMVCSPYCI